MILDNDLLWADSLAFGGVPTVLDLGNAGVGPGQPIKCFFTTEVALAGVTGVILTTGATNVAADDLITLDSSIFAAVGTYEFDLPSNTKQFVKLALEGVPAAGQFSAGVVLPGVQSNS